jgi:hypothetical protein
MDWPTVRFVTRATLAVAVLGFFTLITLGLILSVIRDYRWLLRNRRPPSERR